MKQPSLDILMTHVNVDSKYTLVVAAARRARVLMENSSDEFKDMKPVSKALDEIARNMLEFYYVKEGSK